MRTQQIALDFKLPDGKTLNNYFICEENKQALLTLHTTASGRGERLIYLWGEKGVGLTHLLQGCCHTANQKGLRTLYLSLKEISTLDIEVLEGLEKLYLVCIDGIESIAGNNKWEEAFFDFFNRMHDASKRLIITGNTPLPRLPLNLPDLLSRLKSGVVFQIHGLSDEAKIQALILRAKKRGLKLQQEVAKFLLRRCLRDMGSLFEALAKLDQASLEEKRKLTIPFVKEILKL